MMNTPIYFDYGATTPADPRVVEKMMGCLSLQGNFGNPASRSHQFGWQAEQAVEEARLQVAMLVNADQREIIWTSGATESNNLAIKGFAHFHHKRGRHIITCMTEHPAVLDSCAQLEQEGFAVSYLKPNNKGLLSLQQIEDAIRPDTLLITIMQVNNEIGVIQDIAAIGALARVKGICFHVDAAQSVGKIPIDLSSLAVDMMSFSAHKCYGPKGMGALYVRRQSNVQLTPIIHGGGHERGMRSGTLATHQIVGMGTAFAIATDELQAEADRLLNLREFFWQNIQLLGDVEINGDHKLRVPGNLNLTFGGVDGEALLIELKNLAVSSGSACSSASMAPSYVLKAIGLSDVKAYTSIRFGFGRFTSQADIDYAIEQVCGAVQRLRKSGSFWPK